MNLRYVIELTPDEHRTLTSMTAKGRSGARRLKRAQILLLSHEGYLDKVIAELMKVSTSTIYRTKRAFVEDSLEDALNEKGRSGRPRKLGGKEEALLIATACSKPPLGRSRWTLHLLADRLVTATEHESISTETIRRRLKENALKPWQKKMWCIPKVDHHFVARMEHVLEVYSRPADLNEPVVNFDEAMKQLVSEKRAPIPCSPGQPRKYDYEYRREGVKNIFLFLDRHRGWRHAKVTDSKTSVDFAHCMRDLVDEHYPSARRVHVVLDNLATHTEASLYLAFPPEEARRILQRIQFHYTPPHASWLNMVEIEIGVMNRQCLDRRIEDSETLVRELIAWETDRNEKRATVKWMFDIPTARKRMAASYPQPVRTSASQN